LVYVAKKATTTKYRVAYCRDQKRLVAETSFLSGESRPIYALLTALVYAEICPYYLGKVQSTLADLKLIRPNYLLTRK